MTAPAKSRRRRRAPKVGAHGYTAFAYPDIGQRGSWYAACGCGAVEWDLIDEAAAEAWCFEHVVVADIDAEVAMAAAGVSSSSSETEPTLHEALGTEPATQLAPAVSGCAWCGRPLVRAATGRPKRFCDTGCRQASYRSTSLPPAGAGAAGDVRAAVAGLLTATRPGAGASFVGDRDDETQRLSR